ncbi:hypothetical protein ACFY5D_14295 [Paeniglutamicibacter sp. NPDC012692]|uniref:hypothetical protein n=1 Tax=Paeniglutamicibacter sp. NPDC012692 TaxID=3364388 RepID=UPI0036C0F5B9
MTTHSTPRSNGELDPHTELLLRASDPFADDQARAMEHSRATSAAIPSGTYVPSISQQVVPLTRGTKGEALMPGPSAHRTSTGRRWGVYLAVAASTAIVAGLAVLGPWGNAPQPAAPAPSTASSPSSSEFDANDLAQREAFREAGGKRITGWLRPALPTDPKELRRTGWLLNTYTVAGTGETVNHADGQWTPIDLGGRDTSLLGKNQQAGDLVVVSTKQTDLSLVTPLPGPYGIMVSDPKKLAAGSLDGTTSLMTLDGTYLQIPDGHFNGTRLSQFATFKTAHSYTGTPKGAPTWFKASEFHSYTDPDARSCITAVTKSGNKILAFPAGSTASGSIEGDELLLDDRMAEHPLRVMPRGGWLSDEGNDSTFILDTGATPTPTFTAWPTTEVGTCGGDTGEIVKFAGDGK